MQSESLRVALVGLGNVGAIHLDCYLRAPGINLVAVAERRVERARELGVPEDVECFTDLDALLSAVRPDVVCVATPVATHEAVVTSCARAGAHILCEKPLAIDGDAARRMLAVCAEAGVQLGYAASYRFLPAVMAAREVIAGGALGEIKVISETAVGGAASGGASAMGFVHYPEGGPGGSGMGLVDHGIHFIDIFPWLVGSGIVETSGRGNISGQPLASEWMNMHFENGAIGQLLYNENVYATALPHEGLFSAGEGWDIESGMVRAGQWSGAPGCIHVNGTEGALRIFHYANRLFLNNKEGVRELPVAGDPPPAHFRDQMLAFLEALAANSAVPVSGECGLRALDLLLAVYPE
ncbi:MAG: Gfo/Idh/MocA family oxidoreductase [Pseudomonadota bacterium]